MAFEDRCSPNEANGPGPVNGRVPPPHCEYNNLIVMSENTTYGNQYTCTTINGSGQNWNSQNMVRRENVQPDLGLVKVQPVSPPPSPRSSPSGMVYPNCYQNHDVKPNLSNLQQKFKQIRDETRQESTDNLKFSISSILRPEFGINAIRLKAKTNKMEGPNPGGPNQSILYKPYDLSKVSKNTAQHVPRVAQQQHSKQKINFEHEYLKNRAKTPEIGLAPLGSLCQAVNQIGMPETSKPAHEKSFFSPNKAVEVQKRPDSASSAVSSTSSGPVSVTSGDRGSSEHKDANGQVWPAWVYCTRYSDRPSSGPRCKRSKKTNKTADEKRPRTAFSGAQLNRLKVEFTENRYLTERRRQQLASELGLAEAQIKIWFQNKRAKIKKTSGERNPLALQLMAQGLYNHATSNDSDDEMEEEIQVT